MKVVLRVFWSRHSWWLFVVLLLCVVGGVVKAYVNTFGTDRSSSQEVWGQFGDYFGGILNPILSFCALIGLLLTLRGQHADGVKAEDRHQAQIDDGRFFQLLNLLSKSSEGFVYSVGTKGDKRFLDSGRLAFEAMWRSFSSGLSGGNVNETEASRMYESLIDILGAWKPLNWSLIGIHFQLIFAVIDFIAKSGEARSQSVKFYMSLIKAQLSEEERLVAFYLAAISRDHLQIAVIMRATEFDEVVVLTDPLQSSRQVVLESALKFHKVGLAHFFS